MEKLRIVTLDNCYESIEDAQARRFFGEVVRLRYRGYGPEYPKGHLPIDTTDYIAWHHLFCLEKENEELRVIGAFRQVSLDRCDAYHLPIPLHSLMVEEKAPIHAEVLRTIIEGHREQKLPLIYSSSFTIEKTCREDRELVQTIKELIPALTLLDMEIHRAQTVLGGSVPRFRTDKLFESWGYQTIDYNGVALPAIKRPSIGNDLAVIMQLKNPSPYARECYAKHKTLMVNRLIVQPPTDSIPLKKVA